MAKQKPWGMTLKVGDEVIVRVHNRYAEPSINIQTGVITKRGTKYLTVEWAGRYGKVQCDVRRDSVQDRFAMLQSKGIQLFASTDEMDDFLLRGRIISKIISVFSAYRADAVLNTLSGEQLNTLAGWLGIDITGVR